MREKKSARQTKAIAVGVGLAALTAILLLVPLSFTGHAGGDDGCGGSAENDLVSHGQALKQAGPKIEKHTEHPLDPSGHWRKEFPLMMVNLRPQTIPEVAKLIDLALYYSYGMPDAPGKDAFSFDYAKQMIDAAGKAGIKVAITITPLFPPCVAAANPGSCNLSLLHPNTYREPVYDAKGVLTGYEVYTDSSKTIRLPTHKNQLTIAFVDYIAPKMADFITALRHYDTGNVIGAWYGLEEMRHWVGGEMYFIRKMRETIDQYDGPNPRPLISYVAGNAKPSGYATTIVHDDYPSTNQNQQYSTFTSASPQPSISPVAITLSHPVDLGWTVTGPAIGNSIYPQTAPVSNYPRNFSIRHSDGKVHRLFDHLLLSNYVGRDLNDHYPLQYGQTNRILGYHRMEIGHESLQVVDAIYADLANRFGTARHPRLKQRLINVTLLYPSRRRGQELAALTGKPEQTDLHNTNLPHSYHDFWIGLHQATGQYVYNYAYRNADTVAGPKPRPVWVAISEGLTLLKQTGMRRFMVDGKKAKQKVTVHAGMKTIPGENSDYRSHMAMNSVGLWLDKPIPAQPSQGWIPDYDAVNATSWRIGDELYLLVTHSYGQKVEFSVALPSGNWVASIATGNKGNPKVNSGGPTGTRLSDSFRGIGARVYHLTEQKKDERWR